MNLIKNRNYVEHTHTVLLYHHSHEFKHSDHSYVLVCFHICQKKKKVKQGLVASFTSSDYSGPTLRSLQLSINLIDTCYL